MYEARAGAAAVSAAQFEVKNARDLVVLVVANLYLETVAAAARVDTARAALETADTLLGLATDLKQAGIAAGIDTLRAQVQQQAERQRLIVAENSLAKSRLTLARAIGLPRRPGSGADRPDAVRARLATSRSTPRSPGLRLAGRLPRRAGAGRRRPRPPTARRGRRCSPRCR